MNVCVQRASKFSITKESALVSVFREEIKSIVGVFILLLLNEANIDFIDIKYFQSSTINTKRFLWNRESIHAIGKIFFTKVWSSQSKYVMDY